MTTRTFRLIETPEQLAALGVGTVIIDSDGDVLERGMSRMWLALNGLRALTTIALPARVLLEASER